MSEDELPALDLSTSYEGVGELEMNGKVICRVSFSLTRPKHAYDACWHLTARTVDSMASSWDILHQEGRPSALLRGKTDAGGPVLATDLFSLGSDSEYRYEAEVGELTLGPAKLPATPTEQYVRMALTETPFALPEKEFLVKFPTGEIKTMPEAPPREARVTLLQLPLGEARLTRAYAYEDVSVRAAKATLRVAVPTLSLDLDAASCSADVHGLATKVVSDWEDCAHVLSFLSRRLVWWTSVHVTSIWKGDTGGSAETQVFRSVGRSPKPRDRSPLVNRFRLSNDPRSLQSLVDGFRRLDYKDSVKWAMTFCVASHGSETGETEVVNAFTGLEALVNGLGRSDGSDKIVSASLFKRLRQKLEPLLVEFATNENLAGGRDRELKEKLGELQRRPIANRLVELIEKHQIKWADLWPAGTVLADAIKAAYKRRNNLIHAGEVPSPLRAHVDAVRIRTLTERLVLRVLGGGPEWHDLTSFEYAQGMASPLLHSELGGL
jgi:hypothetical protein